MRQAALFVVLILVAALAQAQDTPKRKSGLWEIKWTTVRAEGKSRERDLQVCVDQATDNPLLHLNQGMRKDPCKVSKVRRDGDQMTVDAVCQVGKTTATTRAVITGNFDSAYKVESKSTYDPPLRGKTEGSASQEASWLGPCKPDQRPGDVILASGKKFNINDQADAATTGKAGVAPGALPGKQSAPMRKPGSPATTQ
jgi:hypothetical protein